MTTGFAVSTQTADAYIKNAFKNKKIRQGYETVDEYVEANRKSDSVNLKEDYKFSIEQLLKPKKFPLELLEPSNDFTTSVDGCAQQRILLGMNSIWAFEITQRPDTRFDPFNFNVCVLQGRTFRFHADNIQKVITEKYGDIIYQEWKQMVKDEIPALTELVNAFRESINRPILSVTSCRRSEKLCRSVGIPVHQRIAFLFPSSYKI